MENYYYETKDLRNRIIFLENKLEDIEEELELNRMVKNPTLDDVEKLEFLKKNWYNINYNQLKTLI